MTSTRSRCRDVAGTFSTAAAARDRAGLRPPRSVDDPRLSDVHVDAQASFHPGIVVAGEPTRVLCEMVGPADAGVLGKRVGHLTLPEPRAVDDAPELVLDLA